jgi:hypothetical protein
MEKEIVSGNRSIKCNKIAFLDQKAAKFAIKNAVKHYKKKTPNRAYECKKCGYWHLTSQPDMFQKQFRN